MHGDAGHETRDAKEAERISSWSRLASRVSCLAVLFSACSPQPAPSQHVEFLAMGTAVSIDVVDAPPQQSRAAIAAARREMEYLGREWYPWENNGELVRLNAALAKNESATISPALARLIERSQEAYRLSDGLFDPAVGRMVERWGFNRAERDAQQPLPSTEELKAWQQSHPTFADLIVANDIVRSRRSDLKLDFGAIGKGFVVDRAIDELRERGIANAMVNAGGNLRAIGHASVDMQPRAWRVAIRNPRGSEPLAWLELQGDESVSTSGDYERFAVVGGRRIHHLLDPRTGMSATHTAAVTVLAHDATSADAASTAIFVAGPERWRAIALAFGIRLVLRVDADGDIEVSRELAVRLHSPRSEPRQMTWRQVDL